MLHEKIVLSNEVAKQSLTLSTLNSNFGALIGFEAGTFPSGSSVATNQEFISAKESKLNAVDNYIMTCNMI